MQPLSSGATIKLLASDPAAAVDVPHFCHENGHTFLGSETEEQAEAYYIQKA
jgi:tRNA 2-thiouridine synthesizing protein A